MSTACSIGLALVASSQGLEIVREGQARTRVGYPADPIPLKPRRFRS